MSGCVHAPAIDLARYDVTVNALAPSVVRTPTTLRELDDDFFAHHVQLQNPAFSTGQVIFVDGGLIHR
ncbi:hypothetical protein ABZ725_47915 [Streptomyces sp. NPDC006872]|uniref:hypothetical protein n=1 Tax=Streptomyces sp. NPDC006872 TaxID=3155720 RepID=UPI0033DEACAD